MSKVIEEAQCLSSRLPETYSQLTIMRRKKIKVKLIKYRSKICNFINHIRIMRI